MPGMTRTVRGGTAVSASWPLSGSGGSPAKPDAPWPNPVLKVTDSAAPSARATVSLGGWEPLTTPVVDSALLRPVDEANVARPSSALPGNASVVSGPSATLDTV